MHDHDFAEALRAYRNKHRLSPKQMAEILAISETDYKRMEAGTLVPGPEEQRRYRYAVLEARPNNLKDRWYRSRKWHWLIPIPISIFFNLLVMFTGDFHEGARRDAVANPPYRFFAFITFVICFVYWYISRPGWPFQRK
jgi:transcriptional regulator with XRE-family HTH domain